MRPVLLGLLCCALLASGCVDLARPPALGAAAGVAAGRLDGGPGPGGDVDGSLGAAPRDARPADAPAPRLENGKPCSSPGACLSGSCEDGVCCATACSGTCHACDVAGNAGSCVPIPAGEDPADECAAEAPSTCGRDGTCDGAGRCRLHVLGTSCAEATCEGGGETPARSCDGKGLCRPAGAAKACAPYLCGVGGCVTSCNGPAGCVPGTRCEGGKCLGPQPLGAACAAPGECGSGVCADGVCCDGACAGACRACNLPGTTGRCTPVPAGADPADECAAEPAASCGRDGACDGAGACRLRAIGTACAAASCEGAVERGPGSCDGAGSCRMGAARICPAGAQCIGAQCATNAPPQIDAGPARTFPTLGGGTLEGVASDDAIPAPLSLTWSKVSGPGVVTFGAPSAATTSVAFSAAGTYVLRLAGSDGAASASDDVTISVLALDVGLAGHWRFDEGAGGAAADASGGGNHGVLQAGTLWAEGRLGKAIDLGAGDLDEVRVPHPRDGRLDFGTADFTIALWIKTTLIPSGSNSYPGILNKHTGEYAVRTGVEILMFGASSSTHTTFKLLSGGKAVEVSFRSLNDGAWHHFAGRKTSTKIELFVDGKLVGTQAHALGTLTNTGDLSIGSYGWTGGDYDGLVDDLRIYRRALDDAELGALAAGAAP